MTQNHGGAPAPPPGERYMDRAVMGRFLTDMRRQLRDGPGPQFSQPELVDSYGDDGPPETEEERPST